LTPSASTSSHTPAGLTAGAAASPFPRTSTACRRSFQAASRATACAAGAPACEGILAAQVAAAERLRRDGDRVSLLFVVGEERGSDGARIANESPLSEGSRFLINGEPTDNRLGLATRGILRLKLRAGGRAAHSSFPELGESAIDKLIDTLIDLRSIPCRTGRCSAGRITPSG
jgi:acetylornithine deacetylase/succinyl-diaminopimelate desuccinylase-like protein